MAYILDFGTPVNTALLIYILYSVQKIVFPSTSIPKTIPSEFKHGYSWMPKEHPPTVLFKTYTPKTLEPFSGKDGGRILLAINSIVFDVTAGRNFYGPDGMYGNFAGRDASRGMAKQSFDLDMLTAVDQPLDKLQDLRSDEIENMKGWIDHFSNKYVICGKLVENDAA
ncbi:cytochrome b5-like heme/steroid binding domain-containing protein [Suillus subaureus]|uniref:Cytochrome b5-like heme/steroid binding domain-containing protein n=1 Tax=Suillus subaureus TaxID=48587 RepID=A0A9P7JIM5_9AGAM|nr:cytochrome b5-like heme/steroid binding domain-containing protein [Suillus subaureus]KAG1824683.1 cytochrome b5-like heme/steroid binding domain-containing protein [Suillus subaureus]